MKLTDDFEKFLSDEVNLNHSRITKLQNHVGSIARFLSNSDCKLSITRYSPQGSWAHKTIIKPIGDRGFDADLLVFIDPVWDWTPKDYVLEFGRVFRGSNVYREKTSLGNRCVTVDYAGDFSIDVVPYIDGRPGSSSGFDVCNRRDDDFEPTASEAYTEWFERADDWAGSNKLREVTRLLKYLRDIKATFSCKSILLTTLLGDQIGSEDALHQSTYYPDLPTALKTLIGRLDDYLQSNPDVPNVHNPVFRDENFTRHWDDEKYRNFRDTIHRYRDWIDDAYDEPDEAKSRLAWQRVFGDDFGKGASRAVVAVEGSSVLPRSIVGAGVRDAVEAVRLVGRQVLSHIPKTVPWMKPATWPVVSSINIGVRVTKHRDRTGNQRIAPIQSGEPVQKGVELRFEAVTTTGSPYVSKDFEVHWQVVNSGPEAWNKPNGLRGGFYRSKPRGIRWEATEYRGIHWVQAFVVRRRDRACIGRSDRFFVVIE